MNRIVVASGIVAMIAIGAIIVAIDIRSGSNGTGSTTVPPTSPVAPTSPTATATPTPTTAGPTGGPSSSAVVFAPGDQNPNDASAASCATMMEIGPHSDCFVAERVANDLMQGVFSAPGTDNVSEGRNTISFSCSEIGIDYSQGAEPIVYYCVSGGDPQDWFEFEWA
jgi:hypothetical protein